MQAFTFLDLLEGNLAQRAAHPALIERDRQINYAELNEQAVHLAACLHDQGVRARDRVGIYLPCKIDYVVAMFATARIGAVFVNLSDQWPISHLDHYANDCAMKALITNSKLARALAQGGLPGCVTSVLVIGEAPEHANMIAWNPSTQPRHTPAASVIDADLASIVYTSGSTGLPKGVMLSHRNLLNMARVGVAQLHLTGSDRIAFSAAFSFTYGLVQLLSSCLAGATLVLPYASLASGLVELLAQQRVTGFAGVPTTWVQLVAHLQAAPTTFAHLRFVTNSGGAIPRSALEALPSVLPNVQVNLIYGSTEGFRVTRLPPEKFHDKMGSMGIASLNTEVYVISEQGLCNPGQEGELVSRGSGVCMGYWGNPEATAEKIKPCAQLRHLIGDEKVCYSGDIVRIDADGYLWYVGRSDALIKCNAIRISPTEVEDLLYRSKLINEVVAFGSPDALRGQVVHVAVSESAALALDIGALERYCRRNMPSHMVPAKFHCWPGDMPRTESGKLDRFAIIQRFGGVTR